jgi:hypothetical protein
MNLELFKEQFVKLLKHKYGISPDDCTDDERIKDACDIGQTPQEYVDEIGEKLDLNEINRNLY